MGTLVVLVLLIVYLVEAFKRVRGNITRVIREWRGRVEVRWRIDERQ